MIASSPDGEETQMTHFASFHNNEEKQAKPVKIVRILSQQWRTRWKRKWKMK